MATTTAETSDSVEATLFGIDYNTIGGVAFALWGVIHVVVGAIGMAIYVTGGTAAILDFVVLDAAVNEQAARMANLVMEFYQALFLVGLTVTVLGLTHSRRGDRVALGLNVVLVGAIEWFFVWFEVLPGHRPVPVAIITVLLLLIGAGFGWMGRR